MEHMVSTGLGLSRAAPIEWQLPTSRIGHVPGECRAGER
jgi:hypothetical protein